MLCHHIDTLFNKCIGDETASKLTESQIKSACTIQVVMERMLIEGGVNHTNPASLHQNHLHQIPVYHEDSKPALLGIKAAQVFLLRSLVVSLVIDISILCTGPEKRLMSQIDIYVNAN